MKLLFRIEYRTRWGEDLVLRFGKRRMAMQYVEDGIWQAVVDRFEPGQAVEYRYEVENEGGHLRTEWHSHRLRLPADFAIPTLRIHDRWIDRPDDTPFYSAAFIRGLFSRAADGGSEKTAGNCTLRVTLSGLLPHETLAVAGSGAELDDWNRIVPMDDRNFPEWSLSLPVYSRFEYKYLIADRRTLTPLVWEDGANRVWNTLPSDGEHVIHASDRPCFPERRWRSAGTVIPVFSLRSEEDFGVGEFHDLKRLADWAANTGQRMLQLLPVHDTTMTGTWDDSYPYNANSTFALHPLYLHLPAAGVEEDEEYFRLREELNSLSEIDYVRVIAEKLRLMRRAFERRGAHTASRRDYKEFVAANRHWLKPYAAYCTLRDEFRTADFSRWGDYARYDVKAVETYCRKKKHEIAFYYYLQYHLHLQLSEACTYAHHRGVVLQGDLPIGVSRTSADAWIEPGLFHMDSQAGAPPDAFSAFGQNWGFPTYAWERMARNGYAWWRARLTKMAEYFDAFRIDHILGFFRIWEIPRHAVRGLLGHFNPALPYSAEELRAIGFDLGDERYTTPIADEKMLVGLFGEQAGELQGIFLENGKLRSSYATQRKVAEQFAGDDPRSVRIRNGLMTLLEDVLFVEDPRRKGYFHPRIAADSTYCYRALDERRREAFDRLHEDFFYRRHNRFWQDSAMRKLPVLLSATRMLACGEDLGMIPQSVPETMRELQILSLEIQRMPKILGELFGDPTRYPYYSICTTSTHDMNPLRAWWKENPELTKRFYAEVLGESGEAPDECEPWICRRIIEMHVGSSSMFTILPLQDWLSMSGELRDSDPGRERINVPAVSHYHWRYRMQLSLERLSQAEEFNDLLRKMIAAGGRC